MYLPVHGIDKHYPAIRCPGPGAPTVLQLRPVRHCGPLLPDCLRVRDRIALLPPQIKQGCREYPGFPAPPERSRDDSGDDDAALHHLHFSHDYLVLVYNPGLDRVGSGECGCGYGGGCYASYEIWNCKG